MSTEQAVSAEQTAEVAANCPGCGRPGGLAGCWRCDRYTLEGGEAVRCPQCKNDVLSFTGNTIKCFKCHHDMSAPPWLNSNGKVLQWNTAIYSGPENGEPIERYLSMNEL